MAGRHKDDTKEFHELTFAEQAKSINAQIVHLGDAIKHHIDHAPVKAETEKKCVKQVIRLVERLVDRM